MIRAFFVMLITFTYILVLGPPLLVYSVLARNTAALYRVGVWGIKMALWLAGVRLEVHGRERIPAGRAVVLMPNHQSNCDPPAMIAILPPILVMAKKEFFRVPVLGRAMLRCGFIPVDRRNPERALQAVEKAVESLKAGRPFLVFPEGTRSPDGRLQRFKKGVFVMAIQAGAPVVPISISGSSKIMRKGAFVIRPGVVRITIHDMILTAGRSLGDRHKIMENTRRAILSGLTPEEWPSDATN